MVKKWQEYKEELYKKDLQDPDNHDGVIPHLEPDILECEVKWGTGLMSKIKTKISKWELLKLKSFCTAKVKVKVKSLSLARFFTAPWTVACTKRLRPWDFPGKSTGVGCHFLLQGLFPTQG